METERAMARALPAGRSGWAWDMLRSDRPRWLACLAALASASEEGEREIGLRCGSALDASCAEGDDGLLLRRLACMAREDDWREARGWFLVAIACTAGKACTACTACTGTGIMGCSATWGWGRALESEA